MSRVSWCSVQAGDVNVDQARQPVAVIEIVMEQDRVPGSCTGPGCVRPPLAEPLRVRHLAEPVACSPSGAEAGRQVLLARLPERLLYRCAGEHVEDRHGQVVRGYPCLGGRDLVAGPGFDSQAQHPRRRGAVPGMWTGSRRTARRWDGEAGRAQGSQARTIAAPPPDCLVARVRIPGSLLAPRSADAILLATRSPTIGPVADPSFPSACVVQPSKMPAAAEASHAACGLLLCCQERTRRGRLGSVTQPPGAPSDSPSRAIR